MQPKINGTHAGETIQQELLSFPDRLIIHPRRPLRRSTSK
jgi:hypothetical protein